MVATHVKRGTHEFMLRVYFPAVPQFARRPATPGKRTVARPRDDEYPALTSYW